MDGPKCRNSVEVSLAAGGMRPDIWFLADLLDVNLDNENRPGLLPGQARVALALAPSAAPSVTVVSLECLRPPSCSGLEFPTSGAAELLVPAFEDWPSYWISAVITSDASATLGNSVTSFVRVSYVDLQGTLHNDSLVPREFLRFTSEMACLDARVLRRSVLPLPRFITEAVWPAEGTSKADDISPKDNEVLVRWPESSDGVECLDRLRTECELVFLDVLTVEDDLALVVVGGVESIEKLDAEIVEEFERLKAQYEFQERRGRRLKLLEERKTKYTDSWQQEISVADSLVGVIIGKQGENLSKIAKSHKVEIRVLPDNNGTRLIRVYGSEPQSISLAIEELDYRSVDIPVAPEVLAWLSDGVGLNLRDLSSFSKATAIWQSEESCSINVQGLARHLELVRSVVDALHNHLAASGSMSLAHFLDWGRGKPSFARIRDLERQVTRMEPGSGRSRNGDVSWGRKEWQRGCWDFPDSPTKNPAMKPSVELFPATKSRRRGRRRYQF